MRTIGNLLWLLLAGFWMALAYIGLGLLLCLTIVGIPFGFQAFKLAGLALWPFGRDIEIRSATGFLAGTVGNVIWFVVAGLWLAIGHVLTGIALMLTVIGIPFGLASFRLASLALFPFGRRASFS